MASFLKKKAGYKHGFGTWYAIQIWMNRIAVSELRWARGLGTAGHGAERAPKVFDAYLEAVATSLTRRSIRARQSCTLSALDVKLSTIR